MSERDFHLHTIVSDGEMTPENIFVTASRLGLREISITDHDAVGAYFHFGSDIFTQAQDHGLTLTPGIELDSQFQDVEIHILGYGIDLHCPSLRRYLSHVQAIRVERIREQIVCIRRAFGQDTISDADVFIPNRDVYMRPHLIHPMISRGLFPDYRSASQWLKTHATVSADLIKPPSSEMVKLVIEAGGRPVLAHPGYYIREHGLNLETLIPHLVEAGLCGIEVDYLYAGTSRVFPDEGSEQIMITYIRELAERFHLWSTTGSDAHRVETMEQFHDPERIRRIQALS